MAAELDETREAIRDATKAMMWALPVILAVRAWRDFDYLGLEHTEGMQRHAALEQALLDAINDFDYYAAGIPDGLPGPHDDGGAGS